MNTGKYDIDWFVKKLQEDEEQNPYVKAWFDWWHDYVQDLKYITYHRRRTLDTRFYLQDVRPVK